MKNILILFLFPPLLSLAAPPDSTLNDKLVLVNIANFSRNEIGKIIEAIECKAPSVIGIDAWFTKPKEDTVLLPILYKYKNIVIAVKLTDCVNGKCDSLTGNYFPYTKEAHVMVDYKSLQYAPMLVYGKKIYPFFCLALLDEYDSTIVRRFFRKGIYKQPLNFYGNYDSFTTIEGKEFLTGNFSKNWELGNKIVILGYLGKRIGHVKKIGKATDYKRSYKSEGKLPNMYGVVLLANILTDIMIKVKDP